MESGGNKRRVDWTAGLCVLAATAGGLGLRLFRLGAQSLWNDEVITRHVAEAWGKDMLVFFLHDSSPPLYYLLLRAWLSWADAEWQIRLLPALIGAATVPLAFVVGRRLIGRGAAIAATFLIAANPFHVYYSQENRYVTLLTLLGLACAWAYLRILDGDRWRDWALWAVLAAAMLYTHYYAAFLLAAFGLHYALFRLRSADAALRFAAGWAAVLLLFLPWLGVFFIQLGYGQPARETFDALQQVFLTSAFFFIGGSEWTLGPVPFGFLTPEQPGYVRDMVFLMTPVLLLFVFALNRRGDDRVRHALRWMLVLVPLLLVAIVSRKIPLYRPKYLVLLLPYYWMVASWGLVRLLAGRRAARVAGILLAAYVMVVLAGSVVRVYTNERYRREDWRGAAAYLADYGRDGDLLLLYNPYSASAWRYYQQGKVPTTWIVSPFTRPVVPPAETIARRFARIASGARRVWILDYQSVVHDPEHRVLAEAGRTLFALPYLDFTADRRFALRAFATSEAEKRAAFTDRIAFVEGRFLPDQLLSGWLEPAGTSRWMGPSCRVILRPRKGQEIVQVAFYVHLPYFGDGPVTATLSVEGRPVIERRITASDNFIMTSVIPGDLLDREVLEVGLSFDRSFIPVEVTGTGDSRPKTALVYGFTMLYPGYVVR